MAAQKITYLDKQIGDQFTALNANQIKSTVNENADLLDETNEKIDGAATINGEDIFEGGDISTIGNAFIENSEDIPDSDPGDSNDANRNFIATQGRVDDKIITALANFTGGANFHPAFQQGVVAAWMKGQGYETTNGNLTRALVWRDMSPNQRHLTYARGLTNFEPIIQADGRLAFFGNANTGDYMETAQFTLNGPKLIHIFTDIQPEFTDLAYDAFGFFSGDTALIRSYISPATRFAVEQGATPNYTLTANGSMPANTRKILHVIINKNVTTNQLTVSINGVAATNVSGYNNNDQNGIGTGIWRMGGKNGANSLQGQFGSFIIVANPTADQVQQNLDFLKAESGINFA